MEDQIVQFGFPGPLRDRLVAAILDGTKTATSGLLVEWELEGEELPSPGERLTVVDSAERPVAVIELTAVEVVRLADADEALAIAEGEAYRTVAGWRAEHERFWIDEVLPTLPAGRRPAIDDDTEVVVQWFRRVDEAPGTPLAT